MIFTSWVSPAVNFKISPTDSFYERARAYRMEVSTEKLKIMVNSTTNNSTGILLNVEKL
ncbi:hypothetical protein DPMN_097145 [Dreissena polymorpha]|uniref:Uncharacterized protein n=1 Tax=Dreissena polymorpha TaxID=45954 RepID=A0A9D4L9R7_DREPO|nr:hypothetical protein DPMN_097145 [Dreissena polymorpha]